MQNKRRFKDIGIDIDDKSKYLKYNNSSISKSKDKTKSEIFETSETNTILDLIENAPKIKSTNIETLNKLIFTLERNILKNQQMRTKYIDQPKKFMLSEIELASSIKEMHEIAAVPELYPKFQKFKFTKIFSELLVHENTDIVIEVTHLLCELIDPSTIIEHRKTRSFFKELYDNKIFEMVVKNLPRLSKEEEDADGFYNSLTILENITEIYPIYIESIIEETDLISILISNLDSKSKNSKIFYCAELLSSLLNIHSKSKEKLYEYHFFEVIKKAIVRVKNNISKTKEEFEFNNNLLDILALSFTERKNRAYLDREILSYLFNFINKNKYKSRLSAINALNLSLIDSKDNCKLFIIEKGLKYLFCEFMKKHKTKKNKEVEDIEENIISIIIQCFINLSDSEYLRLINKFIEKKYEKIDRLIELHNEYFLKLEESNRKNAIKEDNYIKKLDEGYYILQMISLLIGFLCSSGNPGIKERVTQVLHQYDTGISDIKTTLNDFLKNMGKEETSSNIKMADVVKNIVNMI